MAKVRNAITIKDLPRANTDRVCWVSPSYIDNATTRCFNTIQAALDHAIANYELDAKYRVEIRVSPGTYEEQITDSRSDIYIISANFNPDDSSKDVILYNTGADEAHYPLACTVKFEGITVKTDTGGVFGKISGSAFHYCYFEGGYFIESDISGIYMDFRYCTFYSDAFKLEGVSAGWRFIALRHCDLFGDGAPVFNSTSGTIKFEYSMCADIVAISGGWCLLFISSELYSNGKFNFDTAGNIYFNNALVPNGLHFTSNTVGLKTIHNCNFMPSGGYSIPADSFDITADVSITDVSYNGNFQQRGLSGNIHIKNTEKFVGKDTDSYKNITEALNASVSGDVVKIYPGEYNENIVLPDGVNLEGISRQKTIIYANTGTVLTALGDHNSISDLTLTATPVSGTTDSCLVLSTNGSKVFRNCRLWMNPDNTYATSINNEDCNIKFVNCRFNYSQTGATAGSITHRIIYLNGTASFTTEMSFFDITIGDTNDSADASIYESLSTETTETYLIGNTISFVASSAAWGGSLLAYRAIGSGTERNLSGNIISLTGGGGSGNGYWYFLDSSDNAGKIHSSTNRVKITGFANNYFGNAGTGDEIISHFDDITAEGGVTGDGTYSYANSPSSGDIQISGSYLNMYDQALTVGARGADHTSIQNAINAITDASSDKQYTVLVYPGTYTENVDLTGKPYINIAAVATNRVTKITSSSGITLKLSDKSACVSKMTIESTGGSSIEIPAGATNSTFKFRDCSLEETINNSYANAIEIKSGKVQFLQCTLFYTQTGTGGGTHRLINVTGAATHRFISSGLILRIADPADDVIAIEESNHNIDSLGSNSQIMISRTGVVTGETVDYLANGTSTNKLFSACSFMILNGGSGGNASAIKTSGNGCVVTLQSNVIQVLNFTNNWIANVAATDTVYSNFDTVTTAQHGTGAGTLNSIHAHSEGDLHVQRDILLHRNMEIDGYLELASGTTANEISIDTTFGGNSDDAIPTEKAAKGYVDTTLSDYTKKDGTVAFTGTVAGITPSANSHLSTKGYVDSVIAGAGENDLGPFVDKDLTTSPVPVIGNKYIIAGDGDSWILGDTNDVAECIGDTDGDSKWTFTTPVAGNHGWVTDEAVDYTFTGDTWSPTGSTISHTTLQDIGTNTHVQIDTHVADTANPHSVDKTDVSLSNVTDDAQLKRALNDFNGFGAKGTPGDADRFLIEDSADSLNKKYVLASSMIDKRVKVSSNDTIQDYLINKIIGDTDKIIISEIGDGGDENLKISAGTDITNTISNSHVESHNITSHNDTTATGAELETLTNGSNADTLHTHAIAAVTVTQVSDTVQTSTISKSYVTITTMTSTPAAGNYVATFSASGYGTNNAQHMIYGIHVNGVLVGHSEREMDFASGVQGNGLHETMHSQAYVTVNGSETIDVKYITGSGTFYVGERSLILVKV